MSEILIKPARKSDVLIGCLQGPLQALAKQLRANFDEQKELLEMNSLHAHEQPFGRFHCRLRGDS